MNFYIDESGSINNKIPTNKYFVIALVNVLDKEGLNRVFKRFVSSNLNRLKELDETKINAHTGKILKAGDKIFVNGKFKELKGTQFDPEMKKKFVEFFTRNKYFELYYIRIKNLKLNDKEASHSARVFNYSLKSALEYFLNNDILPVEDCNLQLDERNEKMEAKYFLENYLNTELGMNGTSTEDFNVMYFDSSNNRFVQVADVFANLYYSHLQNNQYDKEIDLLKKRGILKAIFDFPEKELFNEY